MTSGSPSGAVATPAPIPPKASTATPAYDDALSASERRRQKILNRGKDRLSQITGENKYTTSKPAGPSSTPSTNPSTPTPPPTPTNSNNNTPKPPTPPTTTLKATPTSSTSTTRTTPSRPVGSAALAAKMEKNLDAIRSDARATMNARRNSTKPNTTGTSSTNSLPPAVPAMDLLRYGTAVTEPPRFILAVLLAYTAVSVSVGGVPPRVPRVWHAALTSTLNRPLALTGWSLRDLQPLAGDVFSRFPPLVLLLLASWVLIATAALMGVVGGARGRARVRAYIAVRDQRRGGGGASDMIGMVLGMVPGLKTGLKRLSVGREVFGSLVGDVVIYVLMLAVLCGVSADELAAVVAQKS